MAKNNVKLTVGKKNNSPLKPGFFGAVLGVALGGIITTVLGDKKTRTKLVNSSEKAIESAEKVIKRAKTSKPSKAKRAAVKKTVKKTASKAKKK